MNEIKNDKYWIRQQDNLEFMKELENESVDLIYCDILFGTQKKFKDYDDNLWKTPQEAMLFYKPRLIEMKRVLKDTGSIYLQCDYRLVHYLKVLMDEVFGIKNFINEIIWYYKSPNSPSNVKYANKHDNILFYTKKRGYTFNIDDIRIEYSESTKKQAKNKTLAFGKPTIINPLGKNPIDVFEIPTLNSMSKERLHYETQKPKKLLEVIIKASSNEGDVVLDVFMGSCTTGEVALELGRKFIGCDIGDRAFEIGKERLGKL